MKTENCSKLYEAGDYESCMRESDLYNLLQFSFLLYLAEISLTVIIDFSIIKGTVLLILVSR